MSSLRDQLQAIYDEHGKLTPDLVVETARPKDHPLHDRVFDRTAGEAAEAWYRHRAHDLIRTAKIVYREATDDTQQASMRAFHAVRSVDDDYVYEPAEKVADDPFMRKLVLRDMERQWRSLFHRFKQFEEFVEIVSGDLAQLAA